MSSVYGFDFVVFHADTCFTASVPNGWGDGDGEVDSNHACRKSIVHAGGDQHVLRPEILMRRHGFCYSPPVGFAIDRSSVISAVRLHRRSVHSPGSWRCTLHRHGNIYINQLEASDSNYDLSLQPLPRIVFGLTSGKCYIRESSGFSRRQRASHVACYLQSRTIYADMCPGSIVG